MASVGNIIRSPICSVLGHVDHGKSSLLDRIRNTSVAEGEAGRITQAIGASIIPIHVIRNLCGDLFKSLENTKLPGLLFIDTPGHAAFTSLRKRGGSIADIAILVVDINEGFKPQTVEALEILKSFKTPFVVAANKIDIMGGWMPAEGTLLQRISKQDNRLIENFEKKLYTLVGSLGEHGINSERFDRVTDYTKQIAIIPTSAHTGEGIPELLMVITGLASKFLENCLECNTCSDAKGTILEVKDEKGLGKTIDVILHDGCLSVGDTIVIGTLGEPIVTKVKALLEPKPLAEMRDKKTKFSHVKKVVAATGVKIAAPGFEEAISGMPVVSCQLAGLEKAKEEMMKEVKEAMVDTEDQGIIVKADSLGSIEAMVNLLKDHKIPIRKARIGNVSKSDLADAQSNMENNTFFAVVMGFNVKNEFENTGAVKVFTGEIIYQLIENYQAWVKEETKKLEERELEGITRPCKIQVMKGYVFRQSNPAVFGVDIDGGKLKSNMRMMNKEGKSLGTVKGLQKDQKKVDDGSRGDQLAVSMDHVTVGRQVNEGDILYSNITDEEFKKMKEMKKLLTKEEIDILKEIAEIMRRDNPVWGV